MIVYALICAAGHRFEAWFRHSADFDGQQTDGALSCPVCGASDVQKAPMAPHVARGGRASAARAEANAASPADRRPLATATEGPSFEAFAALVTELRRHVEEHCVDVGSRFADEARRMHYGETAHRGIYGEASAGEASALRDEGIAVEAIPWFVRRDD